MIRELLRLRILCGLWCFFPMGMKLYAQNFTKVGSPITPMTDARSTWADFDNDGLGDLLVMGMDQSSTHRIVVLRNNGDNTFNEISIANLQDAAFDVGDYNGDGYLDILLAGETSSGQKILDVYENLNGSSFVGQNMGLSGMSLGDVVWYDLDHDTDLDIVVSGEDVIGDSQVLVYQYDGAAYSLVNVSMRDVSRGTIAVFDANNDGLNEVFLSGLNNLGNPLTIIYSLSDNYELSIYTDVLTGYAQSRLAQGDYNHDGYVDLVLTGLSGSTLNRSTNLYQNNQSNGFTQRAPFLDSLGSSSVVLGDMDTDGAIDILLNGLDKHGDAHFNYYRNTGGAAYDFTALPIGLEDIYSGGATLLDFNNDGSTDVFQLGNSSITPQSNLYISDRHLTVANTPPVAPSNLVAMTDEDTVFLSWDAATDDFTPQSSLTYAVYISKIAGGDALVLSPGSDISTGYRRTALAGNAGYRTEAVFHDLPEGNYYWGVQTIDNAGYGSPFSIEGHFTVCYAFDLGGDVTLCQNEILRLSAGTTSDVVNWYSLVQDAQVAVSSLTYAHLAVDKDTIVAELMKPNFGCTLYDTLIVDVIDLPVFSLGVDTAICYQDTLMLEVAGFDQINWYATSQGVQIGDSPLLSWAVLERDTLIAEVSNAFGCVAYDTLIVEVNPLPVPFLGSDTAICFQQVLSLTATGFDSVNWYSTRYGLQALDKTFLDWQVLERDRLIVEVFDSQGCAGYDSVVVDRINLPVFDLGQDTAICYHESISFSVVGFDSINWYSALQGLQVSNNELFDWQVLQADTIITEFYNTAGCVNYDTIKVDLLSLPVFDLGQDTAICYDEHLLLQLPNPLFSEVNWYSMVQGVPLVRNNWFFDYSVAVTDTLVVEVYDINGCINYDSIVVAMNELPEFTVSDESVCLHDSVTLSVPGTWESINWYTTGNQLLQQESASYRFRVDEDITLWAQVQDAAGCVNNDTLTVNMLPLPEFELGENRVYCYADMVTFDVGVGNDYVWTNSNQRVVSTQNPWSYTAFSSDSLLLHVQNADGCFYEDSIVITVNPLPVFEIGGGDEVCAGDTSTFNIDFPGSASVHWYTDTDDSYLEEADIFAHVLSASGWLYAELEDDKSCVNIDSVFVTVHERPMAMAGEDALICYNEGIELGGDYTGINDLLYSWLPIASLSASDVSNPLATPRVPTSYVLEVNDSNGCNAFDTVYVEVNPEIIVNAGEDVGICEGETVELGGAPSASGSLFEFEYLWSPPEGLSTTHQANPIASPTSSQEYVLQVVSGDCIVEYDTVEVTVHLAPEITVSPQLSVGAEESVQLYAEGGVSYSWAPVDLLDDEQSATPMALPLETTEFEVVVTDENGCQSTGYVNVLVQNVVFVPNLFTPNGDGNNDAFKVFGSGISDIRLLVYDLDGNEVFASSHRDQVMGIGWDGTSKGRSMPNDTYIWVLEGSFQNGTPLRFNGRNKGIIKLLR